MLKKLFFSKVDEIKNILGINDSNIKKIAKMHRVSIDVYPKDEGMMVVIEGSPKRVEAATNVIDALKNAKEISVSLDDDVIISSLRYGNIKPKTKNQAMYVNAIKNSVITIVTGPAGTGKTFLAVACALDALKRNRVSRVVLTRPIVEAGEKLGYLPGDIYEKVHPYLMPIYDCLYVLAGADKFKSLKEEGVLEIIPLAYMRGRNIDDAFIILDEAQNATLSQLKMFLTRLGPNSQAVITGDVTQIDLQHPASSGLVH
ncbi:MAG: PhoH family protein, partial [bacterium]|nr:PhoH family protein [bacterium]